MTKTTTLTKILSSTLASATILAALAMPANAGGQIQFQINAQNEQDEKAIKTGLAFYSICGCFAKRIWQSRYYPPRGRWP